MSPGKLVFFALAWMTLTAERAMAQQPPNDQAESWQLNSNRVVACKRHEDAENLIHFVPTVDLPTLRDFLLEMLLSRRCVMMNKGTKVFLSGRGVLGETIAIRVRGETEYRWVDQYDVEEIMK
jgi:hypothetical protein